MPRPTETGETARRRYRAPALVAAAVAITVLSGACGNSGHPSAGASGPPSGQSGTTIVIKNFAFVPADLAVSPGATVTVRNEDPTTHTVTAISPHDMAFDTGNLNAGATATFKAPTSPGSYSYICQIHQFMHGTLTVK